jgi:hypothetical protein
VLVFVLAVASVLLLPPALVVVLPVVPPLPAPPDEPLSE